MSNFLIFYIKCDLVYKNSLFHRQEFESNHVTCQLTMSLPQYGLVGSFFSSVKTVGLQHAGIGILSASPLTVRLVRSIPF